MTRARTPDPDALRLAADWLRMYHPDAAEHATMETVAAWMDAHADAKDLLDAAREHGVPVQRIRAAALAARANT